MACFRRSCFLILCLVLAAGPRAAADPSPSLQGTLNVWGMGAEGDQLFHLARLFEARHPGVKVVTQAIPWIGAHDRLVTAVAGDIAPDVMQLGTTWVPEFASMNALLPVEPLLMKTPGLSADDFFAQALDTCRWDGGLYGVPWYLDVRVIFYRADILAQAGWDHYPRTWDELEKMGRELSRDLNGDGKIDQYAINLSARDEQNLLPFIWQAGGLLVDDAAQNAIVDSPQTRRALDFYTRAFENRITPPKETGQIDQFQAFADGYFLSVMAGAWMVGEYHRKVPQIDGRWSVAMMPGERTRTTFLGGSCLGISRTTSNPRLAWEFVQFMSQSATQLEWNRITGNLPAVRRAWDDPSLSKDPIWSVFKEQIPQARAVPAVECWEAMAEVIKNQMEFMVGGAISPRQAATAMQGQIQQILDARRSQAGNLTRYGWALMAGLVALGLLLIIALIRGVRRQRMPWEAWRTPALFLTPIACHLGIFLFLPLAASLLMSFTDYDLYSIGDWRRTSLVGLENYRRLLADPLFWRSVGNTVYFVCAAGPLTIVTALGAALMLNSPRLPLRAVFRSGFFLPVVTPLIAVAVVWRCIYSPQHGLLNWLIGLVGVPEQVWLGDPRLAMPSLILMAVWKNFGYSMVIFLAGLQAIPASLYEASSIDGAGRGATLRHITLPLLRPTTLFVTIVTTIGYMQFFLEPYVMTDMGGPQNHTLSVVLYLYKEGFKFFHLGYASAIAYTLCAAIALLSAVQLAWARHMEKKA